LFVAKEKDTPTLYYPPSTPFCALWAVYFAAVTAWDFLSLSLFEKEQTPAGQMKRGTHRQNDDFLLDFDRAEFLRLALTKQERKTHLKGEKRAEKIMP
jgi:hypothetical protein